MSPLWAADSFTIEGSAFVLVQIDPDGDLGLRVSILRTNPYQSLASYFLTGEHVPVDVAFWSDAREEEGEFIANGIRGD